MIPDIYTRVEDVPADQIDYAQMLSEMHGKVLEAVEALGMHSYAWCIATYPASDDLYLMVREEDGPIRAVLPLTDGAEERLLREVPGAVPGSRGVITVWASAVGWDEVLTAHGQRAPEQWPTDGPAGEYTL